MDEAAAGRAVDAALAIAVHLGLAASEAIVLRNTNKVAVRLLPCDVMARVSPAGTGLARFEVDLAHRLVAAGSPVAELAAGVAPRAHERNGFEASLWTHYERVKAQVTAADFGSALGALHAGMRALDASVPHFATRCADPDGHIATTPLLADDDRVLLDDALRHLLSAVLDRGAPEQLLHGEPHVGNVLGTVAGPRFIDLETCCIGPVEFDLAHAPAAVADHYPGADRGLLEDCRGLVLAVVAKHRCAERDEMPNRERVLADLVDALRAGSPWPSLDVAMRGLEDP